MNRIIFVAVMVLITVEVATRSPVTPCAESPIKINDQHGTLNYLVPSPCTLNWILSTSDAYHSVYFKLNTSGLVDIQRENDQESLPLLEETWMENTDGFLLQGGGVLNITFQAVDHFQNEFPKIVELTYNVIGNDSIQCEQRFYLNGTHQSFYLPSLQDNILLLDAYLGCNITFVKNPNDTVYLDVFPFPDNNSLSLEVYRGNNSETDQLMYSFKDDPDAVGRITLEPLTSDVYYLKYKILLNPTTVISKSFAYIESYIFKLDCEFTETFCGWKDVGQDNSKFIKWEFDYPIGFSFINSAKPFRGVAAFKPKGIANATGELISPEFTTGSTTVLCVTIEYGVGHGESLSEMSVTFVNNGFSKKVWSHSSGSTGYQSYVNASIHVPSHATGFLRLTVKAAENITDDYNIVEVNRIYSTVLGERM